MDDFSKKEVDLALKSVKNGKAASRDGILPKFITNLGHRSRHGIAKLATAVFYKGTLPKLWRKTKVIAILKLNKSGDDASNFRPILLLSVLYKFFEKLLLRRFQPLLEKALPVEQTGFRNGRNYCEQVLALINFIENGFQAKENSGAVLLNLSSAYDTVWKRALPFKLTRILKCKTTLSLMEHLLPDRKFIVSLNGSASQMKPHQNGLSQDLIFSPILFNVYTADNSKTTSSKFIHTYNVGLVAQGKSFEKLEKILGKDLVKLKKIL